MRSTKLIILGSSLLALMLATLAFFWWKTTSSGDKIWQMIPGTAVFVLESPDLEDQLRQFDEEPAVVQLSRLLREKSQASVKEKFVKLMAEEEALMTLLNDEAAWVSWHVVSRTDFDALYFLPLDNNGKKLALNKALEKMKQDKSLKTQKREYLDYTISEIRLAKAQEMFSYVLHEDYLIGSFTPFLVEDVIRMMKDERLPTFERANAKVFEARLNGGGQTALYVNFKELARWVSGFAENQAAIGQLLGMMGESAQLEPAYKEQYMMLNGFSVAEDSLHYLATFKGQKGKGLQTVRALPNRTAVAYHTSFDRPLAWQQKLQGYLKKRTSLVLDKRLELAANGFDFQRFFSLTGHEAVWAALESVEPKAPEQLFFLQLKDSEAMEQFLEGFSQQFAASKGMELYQEKANGVQIRQLPVADFPNLLMGNVFKGFEQSFYFLQNDLLIIGNEAEVLKAYLSDQASENTWGRSLDKNGWLEHVVQDANVSLYVQTNRAWEILKAEAHPEWKAFMKENVYLLKSFEAFSLQFSHADGRFYTSCSVKQSGYEINKSEAPLFADNQVVRVDDPLQLRPFVVKNHENNGREVLLQDSSRNLYLLGINGEVLWKKVMEEAIVTPVQQVDFYANGKLQYFFATAHALHIIDRKGNYIPGYPLRFPEGVEAEHAQVIDYDGSKRYRFLVSDRSGDLYLFDKGGINLEGWNPRKMPESLASAPFHLRVRNKDCIVAPLEDGRVYMLNRRGQAYKGFPVALKSSLNNPLFVDPGTDFESSRFVSLTNGGLLQSFNLNGKVIERKQLYRPTANSHFKMSIDGLGRSFVIARQQMNNLSVLNHKGDLLFEKDFVTPEEIAVQYYDFGSGREIFAITDPVQEFTYLYDHTGELINQQPVESGFEVGILYYEHLNRYYLYHNFKDVFRIREFSL